MSYCAIHPCKSCPYRTDSPLRLWSSEEFKDLITNDQDEIGRVYGCHKNNGKVCTGFLMDQDKRRFPSIALRFSLSRNNITRELLDRLKCKAPLFSSIQEMAHANFPEIFNASNPPNEEESTGTV